MKVKWWGKTYFETRSMWNNWNQPACYIGRSDCIQTIFCYIKHWSHIAFTHSFVILHIDLCWLVKRELEKMKMYFCWRYIYLNIYKKNLLISSWVTSKSKRLNYYSRFMLPLNLWITTTLWTKTFRRNRKWKWQEKLFSPTMPHRCQLVIQLPNEHLNMSILIQRAHECARNLISTRRWWINGSELSRVVNQSHCFLLFTTLDWRYFQTSGSVRDTFALTIFHIECLGPHVDVSIARFAQCKINLFILSKQ